MKVQSGRLFFWKPSPEVLFHIPPIQSFPPLKHAHNSLLSYRSNSTVAHLHWKPIILMLFKYVFLTCLFKPLHCGPPPPPPPPPSLHRFTSFIMLSASEAEMLRSELSGGLIALHTCLPRLPAMRPRIAAKSITVWRLAGEEGAVQKQFAEHAVLSPAPHRSGHNMGQSSQCRTVCQWWSLDRLAGGKLFLCS